MKHHDKVAVIGGGIAGCVTAYQLAQYGYYVSIFEQSKQLASAGSGNPAAMLYPRISGQNLASQFAIQAYQFSLAFYQSLDLSKQTFDQCGLLQLAFNQQELARIQKAVNAFPTIGESLSADKASQIAGTHCEFPALHLPDAGWIIPNTLCQHLATQPNITVHNNTKITKLVSGDDHIQLINDEHSIGDFSHAILCNAHLATKFEQTEHLAITPVKGQVSLLAPNQDSESLKTIICSNGYLSPVIDGQHSLGASFNTNVDHLTLSDHEHQQNLDKLATLAPSLSNLTLNNKPGRVGLRSISDDRLPLVGGVIDAAKIDKPLPRANLTENHLPWHPRLWVNVAHGSHGFINAPYSAHLLAELIANPAKQPEWPNMLAHLNPNRFLLRKLGLKKLARTIATAEAKHLDFASPTFLS